MMSVLGKRPQEPGQTMLLGGAGLNGLWPPGPRIRRRRGGVFVTIGVLLADKWRGASPVARLFPRGSGRRLGLLIRMRTY